MVQLVETSQVVLSKCGINLQKRKTSSLTTNDDLMNTAFYEPENEDEFENFAKNLAIEVLDYWEKRLDKLTEKYPFLMLRIVPIFVQLLLILLITLFFFVTGASRSADHKAAHLYHLLLCVIF
ncbi:unnamed protein product [Caenorhabditis sp. 36 PRJEB53466]|nr:unnamed protein product [Caenorhabditis sp. 36 PRJEB53466]